MQLHSRCHQFCDVLPLRGRAQFLSRPRNVRWFGGFERHMLRGFNIDIPPRDKRSRARSGDGRLRREKCREVCGNDNKISARFREFQRTSKKKKKGFDPFFGRDSFGDKTLDLWLRFFTIHTANRKTVFPRKLIAQRIMKYRVAPFDRSWIVPFVFPLRSVTRQCLI